MEKGVWQKICDNGGFLCGLIGCLWWLGVTPEKVGQLAYDVGYYVVPFVLLGSGIWIGWSLKRRQMTQYKITAEHIAELEGERDALSAKVAAYEDIPRQKMQAAQNELRGMLRGLDASSMSALKNLFDNDRAYLDLNGTAVFALAKVGFIDPLDDLANPHPDGHVAMMLKPEMRSALVSMPEIFFDEYRRVIGEYPDDIEKIKK